MRLLSVSWLTLNVQGSVLEQHVALEEPVSAGTASATTTPNVSSIFKEKKVNNYLGQPCGTGLAPKCKLVVNVYAVIKISCKSDSWNILLTHIHKLKHYHSRFVMWTITSWLFFPLIYHTLKDLLIYSQNKFKMFVKRTCGNIIAIPMHTNCDISS